MIKKILKRLLVLVAAGSIFTGSLATYDSYAQTTYMDRFLGSVIATMGKQPVDAATTANITLAGYQTIDGVTINQDNMRVLVKNQTDSTKNGVYVVTSANWFRAGDFNGPSGTVSGQMVFDTGGPQAGLWQLTTPNPVQIDNTGGQSTPPSSITFSQFFPANAVSSIAASVTAAQTAASQAAASAQAAGTALSATSTTSNTIGTGAFTFAIQANKNFFPGQFIVASYASDATKFIYGTVTSYSGTSLVINGTVTGGSGTFSNWNIAVAGAQGPVGGGVSSVGLSTNLGFMTVGSSPITSSGTITLNGTTGQTANQFVATPNGSTGVVGLRSIASADLPAATTSTLGAVSTDGSTITNSSGAISCTTGTSSQLGCLKPDGTTITASGGTISSSGGMVLISTQTVSGASSVQFTSGINSTYNKYIVEGYNITSSVSTDTINVRVQQGGSFVSSGHYNQSGWGSAGTPGVSSTSAQSLWELGGSNAPALDTVAPAVLTIELYQPSVSAVLNGFYREVAQRPAGGSSTNSAAGGGLSLNTTAATTGIQFFNTSGTITGTFELYGVK